MINHFSMVSNPMLLLNSFNIRSYATEQKFREGGVTICNGCHHLQEFLTCCWCNWGMVDFQHTTSNSFVSLKTQYVISCVHFNSLNGHLILFYGLVISLSLGKSSVRHFKTCFWGISQTTTISSFRKLYLKYAW